MNTHDPLALLVDQLAEQIASRVNDRLAAQAAPIDERSPWMSIDRAAAYLDLPKQRLYRLTATGAIPHYKQEARLLFHQRELDQWLAQFAQPLTP
jgi:excisionase family DNA binding protein